MIQIFAGYYPEHEHLYRRLYHLTQGIRIIYPNYEQWYQNTFIEGLKNGTRRYLISSEHGQITGCCLIKDTPAEKKICTLYVIPEKRGQGIGSDLLKTALEDIGDTVNITVSEINREVMRPILQKFNFQFSHLFLNGHLEEFEYTHIPTAKPIAHQTKQLPFADIRENLHQH